MGLLEVQRVQEYARPEGDKRGYASDGRQLPRETMTPEQKKQIDAMSHYELCRKWRFAKVGDPLLQGEAGEYFSKVLKEKGGFTPEISKELGW